MKRFISILVLFSSAVCLLSCSYEGTYDNGYADGYDYGLEDGWYDGYDEGYSEGYYEGIAEAQHDIAIRVEDDLWSLARDIEDEYGIHPEDAMAVFFRYADGHDDVSEEELSKAIWAVRRYYYELHDVIDGIEDYWID